MNFKFVQQHPRGESQRSSGIVSYPIAIELLSRHSPQSHWRLTGLDWGDRVFGERAATSRLQPNPPLGLHFKPRQVAARYAGDRDAQGEGLVQCGFQPMCQA